MFASLAPGVDSAPRTAGSRAGEPSPSEQGYLHCGKNGAGHFVKMVHNGIEYGIMASYAEGLNVLRNADIGTRHAGPRRRDHAARDPEFYEYEIDTTEVAEVWRRGSVVGSWLLDLTARRCSSRRISTGSPVAYRTPARGGGRSAAAIDEGVPTPVLTSALYSRFSSRGIDDFADRALSAMRKQFGGHQEKPS